LRTICSGLCRFLVAIILSSLPAHTVGHKTLISHGSTDRGQARFAQSCCGVTAFGQRIMDDHFTRRATGRTSASQPQIHSARYREMRARRIGCVPDRSDRFRGIRRQAVRLVSTAVFRCGRHQTLSYSLGVRWDDVVTDVCAAAARHGATTRVTDRSVTVSGGPTRPLDVSMSSIRVDWFDDDTARVRTGWCIDAFVDYTYPETSPALLVESIMTAGAVEYAVLAGGKWSGVGWRVRHPSAPDGWASGDTETEPRVVRRIPPW
jgi:hypothetical protein